MVRSRLTFILNIINLQPWFILYHGCVLWLHYGNKGDYKAGETFSLRNNNGSVAVGSAAELIFISAFFLSALHRLFLEIKFITRRAKRFL